MPPTKLSGRQLTPNPVPGDIISQPASGAGKVGAVSPNAAQGVAFVINNSGAGLIQLITALGTGNLFLTLTADGDIGLSTDILGDTFFQHEFVNSNTTTSHPFVFLKRLNQSTIDCDTNGTVYDAPTGGNFRWTVAGAEVARVDSSGVVCTNTGLRVRSLSGTASRNLTIKPNETFTAARTLNLVLNDADRTVNMFGDTTVPVFTQRVTFGGPTAARTVTLPDADFTAARTDAANTFTGASTATAWNLVTPLLGTPTSGVLTNCTGLPSSGLVAGAIGKGPVSNGTAVADAFPGGDLTTATDAATVTFDMTSSRFQKVTMAGNRALAVSNDATGMRFTVCLVQDATGTRVPSSWLAGGVTTWFGTAGPTTPPVLSTAAGKRDYVTFIRHGVGDYDGFFAKGS